MKPADPVVRVTRLKTAETKQPPPAVDEHTMGLFVKVIEHVSRLRSRVDGTEARLKYLEALLESRGIQ